MPDDATEEMSGAVADQPWAETGFLSLRGLGLSGLPPAPPVDLTAVRALDLSGNRLTTTPGWLGGMPNLERLDLSGNRFAALDGLVDASRLVELDLSENRLVTVSSELAGCPRLRWLNLASNRLRDLGALDALRELGSLDVGRNRLRSLDGLPSPSTLRRLDASSNQLADLPDWLPEFRALRRLDLSRNLLTSDALAVLAELSLTELFLDGNRIDRIPLALARRHFRRFSITGNPPPAAGAAEPEPVGEGWAAIGSAEPFASAIEASVAGGYQPGVHYFEAPAHTFDFSLAVSGAQAAGELVDLYYKGYPDVPVDLHLGDGSVLPLAGLTRRTALDLVSSGLAASGGAAARLADVHDQAARARSVAFATEAASRIGEIDLVPDAGDPQPFRREATPRVVNVTVAAGTGGDVPVVASESLRPASRYLLRVGVGPEVDDTLVLNPTALPRLAPDPTSPQGWWFDVVVTSADVEVTPGAGRLFLPVAGPGWSCGCSAPTHSCTPRERREWLEVPFVTPAHPRDGSLRCTIYHRNNAVQSILVRFSVGTGAPATPLHGVVDFRLADDLARAEELPPRVLNVLTNQTPEGTHTIVVKGEGADPVAVHLTESGAATVLRAVREELKLITLGRKGVSSYDDQNTASVEHLIADLRTLAHQGAEFWQQAVPRPADQATLRAALAATRTIQVARVTPTVFPWSMVYDLPHLFDDPWEPCELLHRWPEAQAALADYPTQCPYPHPPNTLCPFGFWGFRHMIEQPPSVARGRLRTSVPVPVGAHAATVRSLDLDEQVTAAHLADLRACLAPHLDLADCDSRDDFVAAIGTALPLIYFYCHGRTALLGDKGVDLAVPYLEIGQAEKIGRGDLNALAAAGQWRAAQWQEVPPLIFINGCSTAALTPEQIVSFVEAFAAADAAGVIGTETSVAQPVASELAHHFFRHLMAEPEKGVGQALRRARLDLLAKGNVAGLTYTAFCSADLALEFVP